MNLEKIKAHANQYFIDVLKNHYADFKGRADRPMFWFFYMYMFISIIVASVIFSILHLPALTGLVALGLIVPMLGLSVRRLHDLGKPWYWLLLGIVPGFLAGICFYILPSLVGIFKLLQGLGNIALLVLYCMKGEDKANAWGPKVK
ncbi:MAG: DUF805 domain-containing protein [Alphaproteobacteria bacterium]|nr:DUF805 domain-containing protein [Alphaproteobacteria bacterium]